VRNILVVKLSALGDFVLSIGAMQAIRAHHADARITLLTTAPFVNLARSSGCFDEVWIDTRPPLWRIWSWLSLARKMRAARFDRIYDLQWSTRTNCYAKFVNPRATQWVGVAPGLGVYYPGRAKPIPIYQRHAEMLALAGINSVPAPDLGFLKTDISHYGLPPSYALLVPGSSPTRQEKRWPAERYGELARRLAERGLTPVLIRGPAEKEEARVIVRHCESTFDIDSNLEQIVELARGARVAVGNDTGPTHMIAMVGCPLVAIFGSSSNPIKSRPLGNRVEMIAADDLAQLDVETVEAAVERLLTVQPSESP
jgi:ADP-heptose:LPS heptosyltransferase